MDTSLHTTLTFVMLIAVGGLMRGKLRLRERQQAMKQVILDLALPAVIFLALLQLDFGATMMVIPAMTIAFNLIMLGVAYVALPFFGVGRGTVEMRTFLLLLPSLAPGLSCFSFLEAFLGQEAVAKAALADVGNKVSVLFLSYLIAMHWFYRLNSGRAHAGYSRVKTLALGMLSEPINLVMVTALLLLGLDMHLDSLPVFVADAIRLLGQLMTPLILLFIGVSVTLNWTQFKLIGKLLLLRAGITFCISGALLILLPGLSSATALLLVVFPQSSCSFWPLAHMGMVEALSAKHQSEVPVFDTGLATNMLALSLPFSVVLILSVFNSQTFFTQGSHVLGVGGGLLVFAAALVWMEREKPSVVSVTEAEGGCEENTKKNAVL